MVVVVETKLRFISNLVVNHTRKRGSYYLEHSFIPAYHSGFNTLVKLLNEKKKRAETGKIEFGKEKSSARRLQR